VSVAWRPDINRDAMLLLGLGVGVAIAMRAFATPVDAVAYWLAGTSTNLYPADWSAVAPGYLFYPPPIAQLSRLIQPIGWQVFIVLWMLLVFASFWYCARRLSLLLVVIGIPYYLGIGPDAPATFLSYALLGNAQWPLAAAVILAIDRPPLWAVLFVTKVSTAIGWWWHVFRAEWRAAALGAAATVLLIAVSVLLGPDLWAQFIGFAIRNGDFANPPMPLFPVPFLVRVATGGALLLWGARTNRAWTVPMACGWALPALYGLGFLPFWVAGLQLRRRDATAPAAEVGAPSERPSVTVGPLGAER
jgi:hypothetical protein